ncbi:MULTISPECIES: tannase/feruloyl esterase family alpha/beta hydrolase [Paraburkholderia]|uniref:Tannase/feruloyl esterase family alpha/beta hydrolase n=1 Tax=Paraburkholderia podalyriae TaxID=1938811 RepID=A0ABR7PTI1_9BURK|nr:tannase/feruloyl esterase family alpha/beta hydrolase [Paraburkholderia podalyriae]MBC8749574.1 tannase/feruloyl esterase family alpha/beta hydrolase [Paraburkholderia podalyriae]
MLFRRGKDALKSNAAWSVVIGSSVVPVLLAGCGGGHDLSGASTSSTDPKSYATPVVVANANKSCAALVGKTIDATLLGEPSSGAVVTAAVFKPAVADAPNAASTVIVQGTPDFCQVLVDIKPVDSNASTTKAEVNLPSTWIGKSIQFGGGGTNGTLITGLDPAKQQGPETQLQLTQGYVTLGTDSGHQNAAGVPSGAFALNDESLKNYAYASYKNTHDVGVQLMQTFYNHPAKQAYYLGGSEGGREGMIMAQKYPKDFNGIVSIDPVIRLIGLWLRQLSSGQVQSTAGSWLGGKQQLIEDTVEAACDGLDGIVDHVVSNYKACKPLADAALAAKRCASGTDEGSTCFSDAQLATLRWHYDGQVIPFELANGITSYPGYLYGSEIVGGITNWSIGTTRPSATGGGGLSYSIGQTLVQYFVTKNAQADFLSFNPAAYQARLQELSAMMDMTNPDLGAFYANGGKYILREDLSDKGNGQQTGFEYYDEVVSKFGQATVDNFFAVYGATGLGHVSAGVDAGTANAPTYGTPGHIDIVAVLDDWVVNGNKPALSLTLTNRQPLPPYNVIASKPMCRYGYYPQFTGSSAAGGNLASNYTCTAL